MVYSVHMGPSTNFPTAHSLTAFFRPRSVAVVGPSREPSHIGHRLLKSLQGEGLAGTIIPVTPHTTEIAVPPQLVLAVIDDSAAIVIAANRVGDRV